MRTSKTVKNLKSLSTKLNQRADRYLSKIQLPENDKNIECIEFAIENGCKIDLCFRENDKDINAIVAPLELTYDNLNLVLFINYNSERKKILFSNIKDVKTSILKVSSNSNQTTVVFKLKNILAKRYTLKTGEKVVATEADGSISVANKTEDKASLLNRLLKYGDLCEIVSPKNYKKDMKELINKTLENYGL